MCHGDKRGKSMTGPGQTARCSWGLTPDDEETRIGKAGLCVSGWLLQRSGRGQRSCEWRVLRGSGDPGDGTVGLADQLDEGMGEGGQHLVLAEQNAYGQINVGGTFGGTDQCL